MDDEAGNDDIAARLIAELAGEAEFIDGGGFTIDPEAARRKLADRQLADPDAWVLLVVEAAELAGVDTVELRERAAGLSVWLHGDAARSLAPADKLEELFSWVFTELDALTPDERRVARARQLLALGVNAALTRSARTVSLATIGPEGGRRMLLRPQAAGVIGAIEGGRPAIELRLDATVEAAPSQTYEPRPELPIVAARCGYGRAQVTALGRPVPRRPEPITPRASRPVERDGQTIGLAELGRTGDPLLLVVANGVLLESIDLRGWATGFRALLHDGYERDLSLTRAVKDEAWDALLLRVREVHDQLVSEVSARGEAVVYAWGTPARQTAAKPDALSAMVNDGGNSIGHVATWGGVGLGMMTMLMIANSAWAAAAVLGVLGVTSGAVALYFLRMRKVFGDEG